MYNLSVIIPIYNTLQYLIECVNSVLAQSLDNIEIILVDDESPDNAGEVCDELAAKYKNIKALHKKNAGLGLARNSGLEIASGKYIAFVDSDDYVDQDFYRQLFEHSEKYNAEICYSAGFKQFHGNATNEFRYKNIALTGLDSSHEIRAAIPRIIGNSPGTDDLLPGSACMCIYNLEFLKKHNLKFISERNFISEDAWFNMDCFCKATRIFFSDAVGYNYRYNGNSLSRGYNKKRFELLYHSVEMLLKRCEELGIENYYGRVALYFWINFEKCINQEIRFNRKNALKNIKIMCQKPLSDEWITYLKDKKLSGKTHNLLCKLLYKKRYISIYFLLTIYNWVVH